jgi:hypothetical protein
MKIKNSHKIKLLMDNKNQNLLIILLGKDEIVLVKIKKYLLLKVDTLN